MAVLTQPKQQELFAFSRSPAPMPWEEAASEDRMTAQVVVNRPLTAVYSYWIPDELRGQIEPGGRVRVPFGKGNRLINGYCVEIGPAGPGTPRLKSVHCVVDREPLVSPRLLELTKWIADFYLCGWGQVLDGVIPQSVKRQAGTKTIRRYHVADDYEVKLQSVKLTAKQQDVFEVLREAGRALRLEELRELADCSKGPINGLIRKGVVETVRERAAEYAPEISPVAKVSDLKLNADQDRAVSKIRSALEAREHQTFLLHGVTGSGKTEVYIQAIREVVSYGRQAIVLVPEISLTPQTIERFRGRFESVAVLHSHLSDAERSWHWRQIREGKVQVVVGARSAVFAPTPNLGLIILDEEHETTFKQDATPRYHAREVARERARMENIPLILGSATPTLESWQRAVSKEDVLLSLPMRVESRTLPPVVVVDTRHDPQRTRGQAIGRSLQSAMKRTLGEGGQVILFLNLRGYSPTIWCRACGASVKCPHCDVTLTWHQDRKVCLCHVCNYQTLIAHCPACGRDTIRYLGHGTERLEQEVRAKFPEYRALRMDSDSMRRFGSYDAALGAFRSGDVQILLGTQMIAKGLDFPNVTLVGVVNADTSLHQPDLRAAERTFQLISQVAGRTGRGNKEGRVYVQTLCPEEPAIRLASEHNYKAFTEHELAVRREMQAPPYRRMARVILRGRDEARVREQAELMAGICREDIRSSNAEIEILGPAPAPVAKLRDQYRYHFQLAAAEISAIQKFWREIADGFPKANGVECTIDVDPLNMK